MNIKGDQAASLRSDDRQIYAYQVKINADCQTEGSKCGGGNGYSFHKHSCSA
jgi:hypothetical protein